MPRRKTPLDQHAVPRCIRLSPELADFSYWLAKQRNMSEYVLLGGIVDKVLSHYKTKPAFRGWSKTLHDEDKDGRRIGRYGSTGWLPFQ